MSHPDNKLVVDLDGVIAGPKPTNGSYSDCLPNRALIEKLQELHAAGWTIAIHTSRNVRSFDHNAGQIAAQTAPLILDWLAEHNVPCDELWTNKPWCGTLGFYVDDRAVRPSELMELTPYELLARARTESYGDNFLGQPWAVVDTRGVIDHEGRLLALAKTVRDCAQQRLLIIASPAAVYPAGYGEALLRAGARWIRLGDVPLERALVIAGKELERDKLGSADLELTKLSTSNESFGVHSRDFNSVKFTSSRVFKQADETHREKIRLEREWLEAVGESIAPQVSVAAEGGYSTERYDGGSLNRALLYSTLDDLDISSAAEAISQLWNLLGERFKAPKLTEKELYLDHVNFLHIRARNRENELASRGENIFGPCGLYDPWTINGERYGSPQSALSWLIHAVPVQENVHRGGWHGDFCPGNIVLEAPLHYDETVKAVLIDPRGSVDGKTLATVGDRRYDMGKLVHALVYGYDVIVEGWRDVSWSVEHNDIIVDFKLWDEDGIDPPARVRLYDALVKARLGVGPVTLDDPVVHAMAGLQLLSCATLHLDDPTRVVALICAGLRAARNAGWQG